MSTRTLTRVSLAVAVTAVLQLLPLFRLPQGGTVTPGAWVPILLVAYKGGRRAGLLAGVGYALIIMILDPYFVHPVQVFLDYILAGLFLAAPAFFPHSLVTGVIVAAVGKLASHWLSGVVFFAAFAPEGTPAWLYSLLYNGPIVGVEAALSLALLLVLQWTGALERIWPEGREREPMSG